MTWTVLQTRRFARQYKKLRANTAADVDTAVAKVQRNPEIGERKKGDLANLRVYKFQSRTQLYLLGYTVNETVRLIYLEAIGPHQNFYRDLNKKGDAHLIVRPPLTMLACPYAKNCAPRLCRSSTSRNPAWQPPRGCVF